jgi:hypothetical protein
VSPESLPREVHMIHTSYNPTLREGTEMLQLEENSSKPSAHGKTLSFKAAVTNLENEKSNIYI